MFKFKEKHEDKKGIKINQKDLNDKLTKEIDELHNSVDKLKAKLFKLQYPNGKLITTGMFLYYSSSVIYKYSDEHKIYEVKLNNARSDYDSYKVLNDDNKVYIGLKFTELEEDDEEDRVKENEVFYIIDMYSESVICVNNDFIKQLEICDWIQK